MGRNLPSATGTAHNVIAVLKLILEVLLDPDLKRIGYKFVVYILNNRAAIHNATDVMPFEAAQVVIQLEEHKANQNEHNELYRHIYRLYNQNKELRQEIKKLGGEGKAENEGSHRLVI